MEKIIKIIIFEENTIRIRCLVINNRIEIGIILKFDKFVLFLYQIIIPFTYPHMYKSYFSIKFNDIISMQRRCYLRYD